MDFIAFTLIGLEVCISFSLFIPCISDFQNVILGPVALVLFGISSAMQILRPHSLQIQHKKIVGIWQSLGAVLVIQSQNLPMKF